MSKSLEPKLVSHIKTICLLKTIYHSKSKKTITKTLQILMWKIRDMLANGLRYAGEQRIARRRNSDHGQSRTEETVNEEEREEKYAIKKDLNGKEYWRIETEKDIFKGAKSVKDLRKAAYNYILNGAKGEQYQTIIDGEPLSFLRVSAKEYVYGRQSKELDTQTYKQKMRMAPSIEDLIEHATVSWKAPDKKSHKFFTGEFLNYRGRVGIDDVIFNYVVRIGEKNGEHVFYDINLEADVKVPRAEARLSYKNHLPLEDNIPQQEQKDNYKNITNSEERFSIKINKADIEALKQEQFEIIRKANPANDDYHAWIRSAEDIKTFAEAVSDEEWDYDEYAPDYTRAMAEEAIESGEITVYSSYEIENGTFVTPSKMEAESYAGNGKVYSKKTSTNHVAWIDPTQGMYAEVSDDENGVKFSKRMSFSEQVDAVVNEEKDFTNSHVYVMETPKVLTDLGLRKLPMLMTAKHMYTTVRKEGKYKKVNYHRLGAETLKKLPAKMEEPLLIMESLSREDSVVMVLDLLDYKQDPIIVSVKYDGKGNYGEIEIESNVITSVYGKESFLGFIKEAEREEKILFFDKEKSQLLKETPGVQFPDNFFKVDFEDNITAFREKVNYKNITNSDIEDAKFSIKQQEYEELLEENEHLKAANEALRQQFEITKGAAFDSVSAKRAG